MRHYNHNPGDGLHYINEEQHTSELCILHNMDLVCHYRELPFLFEAWNNVYPEDPMDMQEYSMIVFLGTAYTEKFDTSIPDNVTSCLSDLREIQLGELADYYEELFRESG